MTRRLDRLLRPRSVAVIGGGVWGRNVLVELEKIGFDGAIWHVHPRDGFAALDDLPGVPDAAFVAVNRDSTIALVRALSRAGAGGAVCFASGFAEARSELEGAEDLQAALLAAAGDMPILGPNCYGLINYLDRVTLWPDQHGGLPVESGVALVTQSSNLAINLTMQARSLPIAYVATVGNQAQTGLSEIARALLEDPRVTALGLHVEGIDDLAGFASMASEARALGKPVVVLKSGVSEGARASALSHTGALSGSDAGASALFARLGMARVRSPAEMLETLKLLHVVGPLSSDRIGVLSSSGGEAGLMADAVVGRGLSLPPLSEAQRTGLRAALGPRVALANPLDYHTYIWGDVAALTRTFAAMLAPEIAIGVAVLDFPRGDRCDPSEWEIVIEAAARASAETQRPMAVLSSLPETLPEATAQVMLSYGVVPLAGLADGIAALEVAAWLGTQDRAPEPPLLPGAAPVGAVLLDEHAAKALLAAHGVPIPCGARAESPDALAAVARDLRGPFALKRLGLAHKTEAGAVALGMATCADVQARAGTMGRGPFLLEEMVAEPVAEVLVGVLRDPAHGFVLTLGAGGTLAEVLADSVSLLLPARAPDVARALDGLRMAPLLRGHRGRPAACRAALVEAIMAVQACAMAHADRLLELEINPLIVTPDRAVAADALIILGDLP